MAHSDGSNPLVQGGEVSPGLPSGDKRSPAIVSLLFVSVCTVDDLYQQWSLQEAEFFFLNLTLTQSILFSQTKLWRPNCGDITFIWGSVGNISTKIRFLFNVCFLILTLICVIFCYPRIFCLIRHKTHNYPLTPKYLGCLLTIHNHLIFKVLTVVKMSVVAFWFVTT
jgi:hypothetical protein